MEKWVEFNRKYSEMWPAIITKKDQLPNAEEMDGKDVRRITSTAAVESSPHFSPDGKWLSFISNRYGRTSVYVVVSMGGIPTRLTSPPSAGSFPCLSLFHI